MTQAHNPNDPLFLASRAIDGDLTAEEKQILDRALKQSPELRAEVAKLQATQGLVAQWGDAQVAIDWDAFGESVAQMAMTESESAQVDKVDQLVARWASSTPEIELDGFADGVMVELATRKRSPLRYVIRLGMPLAAAAAIALAVIPGFWKHSAPVVKTQAVVKVDIGPLQLAGINQTKLEHSVVSFARDEAVEVTGESAKISFISLSSAPVARSVEEYHPL